MRLFALLLAGCAATIHPEVAVPPPVVPSLLPLAREVSVSVQGNPDVALFQSVFERTLGRAGFRVLSAREGAAYTLALLGNGSTVSGANEAGSSVNRSVTVSLAVSERGRLVGEHHAELKWVVAYDRTDPKDSFEKFNQRVADYNTVAFEWLAAQLSNQLVAALR